jgi:hypothetical protein
MCLVALVVGHGLSMCLGVAGRVVLLVQVVEHVLTLGVATSLFIDGKVVLGDRYSSLILLLLLSHGYIG